MSVVTNTLSVSRFSLSLIHVVPESRGASGQHALGGGTSVPVGAECTHVADCARFACEESLARLIMGLPELTSLPRGDFLCDALGWIDYLEEMEDPVFKLKEFFPSQSYFFHEAWQLELAARMCPLISRMLFIFHERYVPDYLVRRRTSI